jgi:ComEC/Rec2-related protein
MSFTKTLFFVAPCLMPALGVSVGILLFWSSQWMIGLGGIGCLFLCYFHFLRPARSMYLDSVGIFSLFVAAVGFFSAYYQKSSFDTMQHYFMEKDIVVRGVVHDIEKTPLSTFPYTVTVAVDAYMKKSEPWKPVKTMVKFFTFRYGPFTVGDYVELETQEISPASGSFSSYLIKEGMSCYFFIPRLTLLSKTRPSFSFFRFLHRKRGALYAALQKYCSIKTKLLFELLFLGKKEKYNVVEDELNDAFRNWGIVHMTARSGMHMTIFVSLCNLFMQFVPCVNLVKHFLLFIIMCLYAFFSYSSVSFIRALLTALFITYCHMVLRRINFLHITLLVYVLQLLINPIVLFFLDFQLSFLLTIGIGFFSKTVFLKR